MKDQKNEGLAQGTPTYYSLCLALEKKWTFVSSKSHCGQNIRL